MFVFSVKKAFPPNLHILPICGTAKQPCILCINFIPQGECMKKDIPQNAEGLGPAALYRIFTAGLKFQFFKKFVLHF
jgi:hypothetical protein